MRVRAALVLGMAMTFVGLGCRSKTPGADALDGAAPQPTSDPELSRFAGKWNGWGFVVLRNDGTGSYTDTFKTGPGEVTLRSIGAGKYRGTWGESKQRFGTLELTLSEDNARLEGTWEPDPASTIGSKTGGALTWTRAAE